MSCVGQECRVSSNRTMFGSWKARIWLCYVFFMRLASGTLNGVKADIWRWGNEGMWKMRKYGIEGMSFFMYA